MEPWGFDIADIVTEEGAGPVLVLHGEKDAIVPVAWGRYIAGKLPAAEATFDDTEGHVWLIHARLGDVLQRLASNTPPSSPVGDVRDSIEPVQRDFL